MPAPPSSSSPRVRRWAIASLVANIGIVVTGGAVRLTASGLGCPTWPRCTPDSFIPTGQAGIHEAIEFGNRLLTFVLAAIAVGTFVAAWRHRPRSPRLVRPALLLGLGIPAQAVIGGVSVLTGLNPWIVSGHLLVSMVLIGVAVVLVRRAEPPAPGPAPPVLRTLSLAVLVLTGVVVWIGSIVTASGPHAGDAAAPRTGLNLQLVAQAHADAVFLLVGVTVAALLVARVVGAPQRVRTAVRVVLAVQVVQGVVGYAQWFAGLPPLLVGVHLLGAGLAVASATDLRMATLARTATATAAGRHADSAPAAAQ